MASTKQQGAALFDLCRRFANRLTKKADKSRLLGIAIKGVGGLFKFDTLEQSMDLARDRISRDRPFRVADEGRDRDLGEPKVVGDACEAVPQHMPGDIGKRCVLEDLLPVIGKAAERIIVALAGEA